MSTVLFLLIVTSVFSTEGFLKDGLLISRYINSKKVSILQKHDIVGDNFADNFQFTDFSPSEVNENPEPVRREEWNTQCFHMSRCFNYTKCENGFFVYVYPFKDGEYLTPLYSQILNSVKSSIYYTDNPAKACLFILSLDTMDRDKLSTDYVKDLEWKFKHLDLWNDGENHLILNLFSGTYPDYSQKLMFNYGKAIVAKASSSMDVFRKGFDISLPLLPKYVSKSDENNNKDNRNNDVTTSLFPIFRKYLLSFKGKRYLFGIGSESRNALHVLNNDKDILLLTTCRHGKNWMQYQDRRCKQDNEKYDQYDYDDMLRNSTFCLVPRGRRLGSFRFLEVMKYGCIPVLLSNGWALPFEEILDWSKFSLNVEERNILQLPSLIRSISKETILSMRQQALFIYKTYLATTNTIMGTMLEELKERINPETKRPYVLWNKPPGVLNIDSAFSQSLPRFPFYHTYLNSKPMDKFTAVISAISTVYRSSAPLFNLIKEINLSENVDQIFVVWLSTSGIPDREKWPKTKVTLRVVHPPKLTMNARYINLDLINTDAIFSFDEDVSINSAEIDFAFSVWLSNPDRLVGFTTASHYADAFSNLSNQFQFTSKLMNEYSIIHTSASVYHRYFNHHYNNHVSMEIHDIVSKEKTCESLAMNFIISRLTSKAPIKVAQSPHFNHGNFIKERLGLKFTRESLFSTIQKCFGLFVDIFGDIPLVKSKVAMNPVLYKDPVSMTRKKFKKLE